LTALTILAAAILTTTPVGPSAPVTPASRAPAAPAAAAFQLVVNDDSTITVTIQEWNDADGLEAQLEEHGVPADVDYTALPDEPMCQDDRGTPADHSYIFEVTPTDEGGLSFTIRPSDFQPDETLVINFGYLTVEDGIRVGFVSQHLIVGPVAPCHP
jgi:hypothetical protein